MLNGKKIVIVMPAYNAAKTLQQTYDDIPQGIVDEVLLVDDNSWPAGLDSRLFNTKPISVMGAIRKPAIARPCE